MNKTFKTFGKIVLGTVLSAALILPATTNIASAATTVGGNYIHTTTKTNAAGIKKGQQIVNYAKSLKGKVQYKWGVRDPKHLIFDCSSFTQHVYGKFGVKIGWGANAAYKQGQFIAKRNLRVGDLVNFSLNKPGHIAHVGIYIGNGKFIHNLSPKYDVIISDLNTGYWKNHYVSAARYF